MQRGCMFIDPGCRLRAPVANRVAEVQGCNAVLAKSALERGRTVHRLGCVVSHNFYCSP
jgi:hypothetical protein